MVSSGQLTVTDVSYFSASAQTTNLGGRGSNPFGRAKIPTIQNKTPNSDRYRRVGAVIDFLKQTWGAN